jgi:putative oxidoreductase
MTKSTREWGPLLLRVFLGCVLIYGTQDNVFHPERMQEFAGFLASNGFPVPLASAYLSAWAQFLCGILIVIGLLTRIAAGIMVINFIVALLMVHTSLPFSANISPLAMLFISMFLVLYGPTILSVDNRGWTSRPGFVIKGSAISD